MKNKLKQKLVGEMFTRVKPHMGLKIFIFVIFEKKCFMIFKISLWEAVA